MGDWVPFGSLIVAVVAVIIAAFSRLPVVSRSREATLQDTISELRGEVLDMRSEIGLLRGENDRLRARVNALLEDNEYWRTKYQQLDRGGPMRGGGLD